MDHLGSGREWELTRKSGGLFILPGSAFGTSRTGSRFLLRDLVHNKVFLERDNADLVAVSGRSKEEWHITSCSKAHTDVSDQQEG